MNNIVGKFFKVHFDLENCRDYSVVLNGRIN